MSTLERDSLAVERAEAVFNKWRAEGIAVWDAPDSDFKAYMDTVSNMQHLYDKTAGEGMATSTRVLHESAKRVLLAETPKLEEGLLHILLVHNSPVTPEKLYDAYKTVTASKTPKVQEGDVPAGDRGMCFIPDNALWRMHLIVRAMVRRRMVKRCCRIVKNARRPTLLESLRLLARQRFNPKHVSELPWADLQERVNQWRQFVRVAIVVLLASERRICERIFNAPELSEFCFAEICLGTEKLLFEFIEAFASSKKSPERLFPLLESYETLSQIQPAYDEIFAGSGGCKALRNEMTVSMSRVGVAVRGVFSEMDKFFRDDVGKLPGSASVYGMTSYMVNYFNALYAYNETLTRLYTTSNVVMPVPKLMRSLQDDDEEEGEEYVEEYVGEEGEEEQAQFYGEPLPEYMEAGTLISKKLQVLEDALKEKARTQFQKDPEKQHFFLMNNVHYMASRVKEKDLRKLLGDDWIRDAAERVQEHANEYMRLTWSKVGAILKDDHPGGGFRISLKSGGKDKLAKFCLAVDEVYRGQYTWKVNPGLLEAELQQAVKLRLVTPYTEAFERLIGTASLVSKNPPKNVKHPSIVAEQIMQLYDVQNSSGL